jgi:hypothetical protein
MSNNKISKTDTQLTDATNYNSSNLIFNPPINEQVPCSPLCAKVINILVKNPNNTIGDLIIPTESCFSFGVSISKNLDGKENGYQLPICLYNKDGASKAEEEWVKTVNNFVDDCKKHLIKNRKELGKHDLEMADLKKLSPFYYKKDQTTGEKIGSPMLYSRLIYSKKNNKILTRFTDDNFDTIDPISLLGKYCTVRASIKFESIYIGSKISIRYKVYDAIVKINNMGGIPQLLTKNNLTSSSSYNKVVTTSDKPPLGDDEGSMDELEDEDIPIPKKVEEKPVVRKTTKIVKK